MIEYAIKRGEIYWIEPVATFGSEIKKKRPAVVVSKDNCINGVVTVVYMTTKLREENGDYHRIEKTSTGACDGSIVLFEQISSVSTGRLVNCCGRVSDMDMEAIDEGIMEQLDLTRYCEPGGVMEADSDVQMELDFYKRKYEELLERIMQKAKL